MRIQTEKTENIVSSSAIIRLFLASINSNIPEFNFSSTPTPLLGIHG